MQTKVVADKGAQKKKDKAAAQRAAVKNAKKHAAAQAVAKLKSSKAGNTWVTQKTCVMFDPWKKIYLLDSVSADMRKVMKRYSAHGCKEEQELLADFLGRATLLKRKNNTAATAAFVAR